MMISKELVLDYFKKNIGLTILFIIITTLTFPLESIGIPILYGKMFTNLHSKNKFHFTKIIIISIILLYIFIQIFYVLKNLLFGKIIPKYLEFTRKKLFQKIVENYETDFKDLKLGKNIPLLFELTRDLKDCVSFFIDKMLPILISIFGILIYFGILDYKLFLLMFVLMFGFFTLFLYLSKKIVTVSAVRERAYLNMTEKVHDSFDNLMNIYLNNEKENEIHKNDNIQNIHTKLYQKQITFYNVMETSLSFYSIFIFIVIIIYSFTSFKKGKYPITTFISVALILLYYLGFLLSLSRETTDQLLKMGIIKCSQKFLNEILAGKTKKYNNVNSLHGDIEFKNIYFSYDDSQKIFTNFNLVIKKGQKVGIIGSSGSGKTTLMKLLLGLHSPQKGKIIVNQFDIKNINPTILRDQINYINQRTGLFSDNVINNIKYGNSWNNKDIISLLKKYQLDTVFQQLKNGIYSNVGVQGKNVSLGMQKVIMNCRGLLKNGYIVVLDEPLAGLDTSTRMKMIKLINDMCKNKTLIVITHDKEILPYMDKTINLNSRFSKK